MEEVDKGWLMIMICVSGRMFLLVPAQQTVKRLLCCFV